MRARHMVDKAENMPGGGKETGNEKNEGKRKKIVIDEKMKVCREEYEKGNKIDGVGRVKREKCVHTRVLPCVSGSKNRRI